MRLTGAVSPTLMPPQPIIWFPVSLWRVA